MERSQSTGEDLIPNTKINYEQQDLISLKGDVITLTDKVIESGFKDQETQNIAKILLKRLAKKIQNLYLNHLSISQEDQAAQGPHNNQKPDKNLPEIKEKLIALVDQLAGIELKDQESKVKASAVSKTLLELIQTLSKEHFGGGIPVRKELRLEDLRLAVCVVKDCKKEGLIGCRSDTSLGIKDQNAYLIATSGHGLTVIADGDELYSAALPEDNSFIYDIIFVPPLNSFLFAHANKLYIKEIDDKPPHPFIDLKYDHQRPGACFRYSTVRQRLIARKDRRSLIAINLKTRKVELELKSGVGCWIEDYRIFGHQEDHIVAVSYDGHVVLFTLDPAQNRGLLSQFEIGLSTEKHEQAMAIAVCDRSNYALVEIGGVGSYQCSRMIVLKLSGDVLVKTATLDKFNQDTNILFKYSLDCCGYAGDHILWVGLSWYGGIVQVYDYDTETGVLKELEEMRVSHQEGSPYRLHKLGGKFYYTGSSGQLMCLSLAN